MKLEDIQSVTHEGTVKSLLAALGFIGLKLNGSHTTIANRGGPLLTITTVKKEKISFTVNTEDEAKKILEHCQEEPHRQA